MSSNPYEAPQTTPPPDPLRAYRWVGTFFLALSGLLGLLTGIWFMIYVAELLTTGNVENKNSFILIAFIYFGITTGLFFAGRYFRRKGRRPFH